MSITPQKLKEMVAEMAEGPLRTAVTGPLLNALWDAAERIETLEGALEPFARYTSEYILNPETPDHGLPSNTPHRVGDYRRAAAALAEGEKEP